jgi:hypothetical protein
MYRVYACSSVYNTVYRTCRDARGYRAWDRQTAYTVPTNAAYTTNHAVFRVFPDDEQMERVPYTYGGYVFQKIIDLRYRAPLRGVSPASGNVKYGILGGPIHFNVRVTTQCDARRRREVYFPTKQLRTSSAHPKSKFNCTRIHKQNSV